MSTRVTATEVARSLSDLLNRFRYRGEVFDVIRGGEVVARLGQPPGFQRATVRDLVDLLKSLEAPDDELADDLEALQAGLLPAPPNPWDS